MILIFVGLVTGLFSSHWDNAHIYLMISACQPHLHCQNMQVILTSVVPAVT
ncbi:hypothetical protein M758_UG126400 [Ceratodon purpureus]|nr:hypothetical protein M758_UG126400 [Ceratodon purpureus]